jgi:uncharacterized membrane protein HdeD (DUF308 family)
MAADVTKEGTTLVRSLAGTLAHDWWVLLLRGIVAIIFGVLIFARPGPSLSVLLLLFGAFAMADGILGTWTAITHREDHENWILLLIGGLLGIGIGALALFYPGITALGLLFYIAIWAMTTGVIEIVAAIRLRKQIHGEWRLVVAGLLSVALGVLLIVQPAAGLLGLLWLVASFAIVFGLSLIALSFKVKGFAKHVGHVEGHPA